MNRSDWLTDELIEAAFERRAGRAAPGDLRETILTLSAASNQPWPWRRQFRRTMSTPVLRPTMLTGIAAATVIGAIAVGAAFFVTRPDQPAVGAPSPSPNATVSPSVPASPSTGPSAAVVAPRAAAWTATGMMITPLVGSMAGLLPDGRVLVVGAVGGSDGGSVSADGSVSAELYDPGTGTWTSTGSMVGPRPADSATLLADGKVLVAGGTANQGLSGLASAEVYDPVSGTWTVTGAMHTARYGHSATLLRDGKVLVAGGTSSTVFGLSSAEVYDPVSGTWTATGAMGIGRQGHTATLLRDGKVLVVGGESSTLCAVRQSCALGSAELYDPISGTWTATGRMVALLSDRYSVTLLADGKVLVAGGQEISGIHGASASAELYDPQSGAWTATGAIIEKRMDHIATLLADGRVLVIGGGGAPGLDDGLRSPELYDPASGTWRATASMLAAGGHTATLLPDGKVLVTGGTDGSAELYDPGSGN
jgi:N-acetylneuraminic acid mutarotase